MYMTTWQRNGLAHRLAPALPVGGVSLLRCPELAPSRATRVFVSRKAQATPPPRLAIPRAPARYRTGVFCVHFSADGREHGMWFVDGPGADDGPPPPLPEGLFARWHESATGTPRADVCRVGHVLCDALFLTDADASSDPSDTRTPLSARQARDLLRSQGLTAQQAALLSTLRQRPLLATVARRVELPPPMARQVHRLLLSALCDPNAQNEWREPIALGA